MIDFLSAGKCHCGKQATTIVVIFLSMERKVDDGRIAWSSDGFTMSVPQRIRLLANTELMYACDDCQNLWDGFSALKCKLSSEIQQLITISEPKQRQINL